jgi:hypothetical protein
MLSAFYRRRLSLATFLAAEGASQRLSRKFLARDRCGRADCGTDGVGKDVPRSRAHPRAGATLVGSALG